MNIAKEVTHYKLIQIASTSSVCVCILYIYIIVYSLKLNFNKIFCVNAIRKWVIRF